MNARVSGLMVRLNRGERLDYGKARDARGGQDYGKVSSKVSTETPPFASSVTTLVTGESPPAANDPDRRAAVLHLSRCGQCAKRRTPGSARPGYCIGRDDLPLAYGLLHALPGNLGDDCPDYRPRGGPDKT